MKPFLTVHLLDEVWGPFLDICQGFVLPKVDLFKVEGLEKALYHGVLKGAVRYRHISEIF